jgi:N-acetylmuramoyl-L-alanine amidase
MLDPGHGWSSGLNRYGRPITTIQDDKAIIVPNSMGHHLKDYQAGYYREDFGTIEIARAAKESLEQLGYEVHTTRGLGSDKEMNASYHLANKLNGNSWKRANWKDWKWIQEATLQYNCTALVSIHTNAGGGTGVGAFYYEEAGKPLASAICAEISDKFGLPVRRVTTKGFLILRGSCKGQTCLVECAFHDSPKDLKLLLDPNNIREFGYAIARGVNKFLSGA